MTKTEGRMRRFAVTHILRCGSDTEMSCDEAGLQQRCKACLTTISFPFNEHEDPGQLLAVLTLLTEGGRVQ